MQKNSGRPGPQTIRVAGRALPRQPIHIHFAFGRHATAGDFAGQLPFIELLKPQAYSSEDIDNGTSRQHAEELALINKSLPIAGKDGRVAAALMDWIGKGRDDTNGLPYLRAMMEHLIASPMIWYPLERHSDNDWKVLNDGFLLFRELRKEASLLAVSASADRALEIYADAIRLEMRLDRMRENDLLERLPGFGDELAREFPALAGPAPIRIFSPMGCAHAEFFRQACRQHGHLREIRLTRSVEDPGGVLESDHERLKAGLREGGGPQAAMSIRLGALLEDIVLNVAESFEGFSATLEKEKMLRGESAKTVRATLEQAGGRVERADFRQMLDRVLTRVFS